MTFASPELLLGLLLVPIALALYLLVQRRRARYVVRFTNVDLLTNLVPRAPRWRRHVPTALYLAAVAALAIALARPSAVLNVPREEATVMLAMDVSRSMLATDVDPDRLTAAQAAAETFVDQLPAGFRVGLVAFSTDARLVVAPTTDRGQVHARARQPPGRRRDRAGRRDRGLAPGDRRRADDRRRHRRPAPRPHLAVRLAVAVRHAGCGPAAARGDRAPVRRRQLDRRHRAARRRVRRRPPRGCPSTRSRSARRTARSTSRTRRPARCRRSTSRPTPTPWRRSPRPRPAATSTAPTSEDLAQIYESLGSKVGYTQQEQEVTQWFAAAALLLVLGGAGLAALWFNRIP